MSQTLTAIRRLIGGAKVRVSDHAYDELANDHLFAEDLIAGVDTAIVVEDYPLYGKGPCVLVLQRDAVGEPVHALWGIPAGAVEPAVLITAYRPDPAKWEPDFVRRR